MIRFFCTKCNRIKRFRHYPKSIENKQLLDPSKRIGLCDSHSINSRHFYNRTRNVRTINIKHKPIKIEQTVSKRKRA